MENISEQNPIRILLVDDHPIVRAGLAMLGKNTEFQLAGSVDGGEKALLFLKRLHVDIVLLDLRMPKTSGLDVLPSMLAMKPAPKVIILSSFNYDEDIYRAAEAEHMDTSRRTLPVPRSSTPFARSPAAIFTFLKAWLPESRNAKAAPDLAPVN
jgi:CheY-like chemotaxis protein